MNITFSRFLTPSHFSDFCCGPEKDRFCIFEVLQFIRSWGFITYIHMYIYIPGSGARFARALGPGPWWALPWSLVGPPLALEGVPLGPGGALD